VKAIPLILPWVSRQLENPITFVKYLFLPAPPAKVLLQTSCAKLFSSFLPRFPFFSPDPSRSRPIVPFLYCDKNYKHGPFFLFRSQPKRRQFSGTYFFDGLRFCGDGWNKREPVLFPRECFFRGESPQGRGFTGVAVSEGGFFVIVS